MVKAMEEGCCLPEGGCRGAESGERQCSAQWS